MTICLFSTLEQPNHLSNQFAGTGNKRLLQKDANNKTENLRKKERMNNNELFVKINIYIFFRSIFIFRLNIAKLLALFKR